MADENRKESPINVLMNSLTAAEIDVEALKSFNDQCWTRFKDFDKANNFHRLYEEFTDAYNNTDIHSSLYEQSGNDPDYDRAQTEMKTAISIYAKMHEMMNNPELVYSKEEMDAIYKNGKIGNELNDINHLKDAEVEVIASEAQDQVDKVSDVKKEGIRSMDKADAAIRNAEASMNYAQYVLNFLNEMTEPEKEAFTKLMQRDTISEEELKKAEDIFNALGQDSGVIRSLSSYVSDANKSAFKKAQVEVAKHPIEFMLNSMRQAIKDYQDAKSATMMADSEMKKGMDSLKQMAMAIVQSGAGVYKSLTLFTTSTAKEFTEEVSRTAHDAWEQMTDIAQRTASFMRTASKKLTIACDMGLELVTGGYWSKFCQNVEKKAADFINTRYGMETQNDFSAIRAKQFHLSIESVFGLNGQTKADMERGVHKLGLDKITNIGDRIGETLAYYAAQAHSYMTTGHSLNFEIGTDKESGNLYSYVGEAIKDANGEIMKDSEGKEMVREGNAFWRDVKSNVWGMGEPSPADVLHDVVGEPLHNALKNYEEARGSFDVVTPIKDMADTIQKEFAGMKTKLANDIEFSKQVIGEGLQDLKRDVAEDFKGVKGFFKAKKDGLDKTIDNIKTRGGEVQVGLGDIMNGFSMKARAAFTEMHAEFIGKAAAIRSGVLGLESKVYGELANLASKHVKRVKAKVEKCIEIDKMNYTANLEIEKAVWNLSNIHPYQAKEYVPNPYLTYQKEVLMAASPTLVNSFMIHKINQRLNADHKLFFKNAGYDEKTFEKAKHTLNDQIHDLKQNIESNLEKLAKAKDSLEGANKITEILLRKSDEKLAEAIEVRKDGLEGKNLKETVAEVMRDSGDDKIQDGMNDISDAFDRV